MTRRYRFVQADVFTDRAFSGNQLAVFTDARGLSAEEMQTLAREMNFSESTFVLPPEIPDAVKRVRIFTPRKELPMAGHPTVGTAYVLAWQSAFDLRDGATEVTLQLGIGAVKVAIEAQDRAPRFVWMAHREPEFGAVRDDRERIASALGISPEDVDADYPLQVVSTGVPFLFVPLRSLAAARRCRPNASALAALPGDAGEGVYVFTTETVSREASVHVRMFSPHTLDVPEDPATGSGAAPLGGYLARYGLVPHAPETRFVCEQGIEMGRPSRIHVEMRRDGERITGLRIGGQTVIVAEGDVFWE